MSSYHDIDDTPRDRALAELLRRSADEGLADLNVAESMEKTRGKLARSLSQRPVQRWWERDVVIPVPVAIAAGLALFMIAIVLTLGDLSGAAPGAGSVADLTGNGSFNVQVTVDGTQSAEFLQWLEQQEKLQTVTIQLPQTETFQIRGEPVIRRRIPGDEENSYEIVPLEPAKDSSE